MDIKTKRAYAKPGTVTVPAFMVWYRGDDYVYFLHAKTLSEARTIINNRHGRVRGYTNLRSRRFHALDDRPITYVALVDLGFASKNAEHAANQSPICTCDLCLGGQYAKEK